MRLHLFQSWGHKNIHHEKKIQNERHIVKRVDVNIYLLKTYFLTNV